MLFEFYNRERFPHHIADSSSWMICRNDEGYCAAIPRDPIPPHDEDLDEAMEVYNHAEGLLEEQAIENTWNT